MQVYSFVSADGVNRDLIVIQFFKYGLKIFSGAAIHGYFKIFRIRMFEFPFGKIILHIFIESMHSNRIPQKLKP